MARVLDNRFAQIAPVVVVLIALCATGSRGLAQQKTITVGASQRSFIVRVPGSVAKARQRVPLVVVLHGGGGNALNAEFTTGFTAKAEREGFIVAYPEGTTGGRLHMLTWNAGHCCGYAMDSRIDDIAFINALLDHMIRTYPIDSRRVYVTGISNGGMLTHRVGSALSHRIAAIAPVVGALFGDEKPARTPVAALMLNGMKDESIPWNGGQTRGGYASSWDGTPVKPAIAQMTFWAGPNGCRGSAVKKDKKTYTRLTLDCPRGRDVVLVAVKDQGHAWPGGKKAARTGDEPSHTFDATDAIWDFFKAHSK